MLGRKNLAIWITIVFLLFSSCVAASQAVTTDSQHPGWKWGAKDEIGTLNMMNARSVLAALALVKQGTIYDLGVTIDRTTPEWPGHAPVEVVTFRTPSGLIAQNDQWFVRPDKNPSGTYWISDYLIMSDQVGTQIDSLAHIVTGPDHHWYNGYTEKEFLGDFGPARADSSTMPPIIARGVLIDVAGLKNVPHLPSNYGITKADLQQALARQKTKLHSGDVVLIRTGAGATWPDKQKFAEADSAGITMDAARWLTEDQQAMIIASDTSGLEQNILREGTPELLPVHRYLLVEHGLPIGELHYLEDLAHDGVYEFAYVCLINKIRGTTAGFGLRPIAIR